MMEMSSRNGHVQMFRLHSKSDGLFLNMILKQLVDLDNYHLSVFERRLRQWRYSGEEGLASTCK